MNHPAKFKNVMSKKEILAALKKSASMSAAARILGCSAGAVRAYLIDNKLTEHRSVKHLINPDCSTASYYGSRRPPTSVWLKPKEEVIAALEGTETIDQAAKLLKCTKTQLKSYVLHEKLLDMPTIAHHWGNGRFKGCYKKTFHRELSTDKIIQIIKDSRSISEAAKVMHTSSSQINAWAIRTRLTDHPVVKDKMKWKTQTV